MADMTYQSDNRAVGTRAGYRGSSMDWGAVWAGLFTFMAIWTVFGALGFAIFAGSTSAGSGQAGGGLGVGIGIWTVVLTIVAMWVAGHETGKLAGLDGRYEAVVHGMVMFGLAVAAVILISLSGGMLFGNGSAHTVSFSALGWGGFAALFLGWLAAMSGAASGVKPKGAMLNNNNVRDIRPAA